MYKHFMHGLVNIVYMFGSVCMLYDHNLEHGVSSVEPASVASMHLLHVQPLLHSTKPCSCLYVCGGHPWERNSAILKCMSSHT